MCGMQVRGEIVSISELKDWILIMNWSRKILYAHTANIQLDSWLISHLVSNLDSIHSKESLTGITIQVNTIESLAIR